MRQLKYHEKKLLKKVDFLKWKSEDNVRELQVGTGRQHVLPDFAAAAAACPTQQGTSGLLVTGLDGVDTPR
jgi:hypothetical protein